MKCQFVKTTYFFVAGAIFLVSCSGVKNLSKVNNYDDAYFETSDLNGRGFYAEGVATPSASGEASAKSGSYGQTYSDRLRHFGGSSLQPAHRPAVVSQPCNRFRAGITPWGFNPYMGYSPMMMMGNPMMMGNTWGSFLGNPMMVGYQPWYSYNDPYWMYYNQMYNPNMYWGGGSFGGWNNNGWNNGSGNNWNNNSNTSTTNTRPSGGFVNNPKPASGSSGFSNSGVRRNNYQSGTPASTSGRSSSWGSGSTSSGSYNNGSSGTSRSSTWTPGGNTQQGSFNSGAGRSSNAVQGTSGRRR
jgi:hypothetical protein